MTSLLGGEVAGEENDDFIERVSIPGRLTDRTVKLFSGQVLPVIEMEQVRGLYGWRTTALVDEAVRAAAGATSAPQIRVALRELLTRVYHDQRNHGLTSADRALNFAVTNAFQAAHAISEAMTAGLAFDRIGVERSPFCRADSDCWDVKLRFFDPENSRRARRVVRFTIDVSDQLPVTVGPVRGWRESTTA
jgi:cyanobactin maturation PatA/PatG family protease